MSAAYYNSQEQTADEAGGKPIATILQSCLDIECIVTNFSFFKLKTVYIHIL
jgi:hypothetical protein